MTMMTTITMTKYPNDTDEAQEAGAVDTRATAAEET